MLFVLRLLPDVHALSYRCVATFRGRAGQRNWRPRTLLQTPNGLFIKDKVAKEPLAVREACIALLLLNRNDAQKL